MKYEPDVEALVIGGGPAGCSAAIALARAGFQTMMCEARPYPHPKVCGEFLSPECTTLLETVGLHTLLVGRAAKITRVRLTASDGPAWESHLPGVAWGLSRQTLDAALAHMAACEAVDVRPGVTVTGVTGDLTQGFDVETRTRAGTASRRRARLVIAAHGKRSRLDRVLGRPAVAASQSFMAFKTHFNGPPLTNRIELHAFPGGYCGLSEIEMGLANLGVLVHEHVFRQVVRGSSAPLPTFVEWMRRQNHPLDQWLAGARPAGLGWLSIGQVSFAAKRAVENDVLMTGDAAGLIAPLAGDGIAMALQGGWLAGQHGAAYLWGDWSGPELKHHYLTNWRRLFGPRLQLGQALQNLMLRPRLFSLAVRLVTRLPSLGQHLIQQTRATPYELAAT